MRFALTLLLSLPASTFASAASDDEDRLEDNAIRVPTTKETRTVEATRPPASPGADPLEAVASLVRQGWDAEALEVAQQTALTTSGRTRAAAWLATGILARRQGKLDLALDAFVQVWESDGTALQSWGAYNVATVLAERGEPVLAGRLCADYARTWPSGPHKLDCLQVQAIGAASEGEASTALALASRWDRSVRRASIREPIELVIADWEAEHAPAEAITRLRRLATSFKAPLTGQLAAEKLDEMAAQGIEGAGAPTDPASLRTRATSLKEGGQVAEAWAAFEELERIGQTDATTRSWVDRNRTDFAYDTRQWTVLDDIYEARYARSPSSDTAWSAFRAASRGGLFERALVWEKRGSTAHRGNRRWYAHETIGQTMLLAGEFEAARDRFDRLASTRSSTGIRNSWFAALASWQAGDTMDAVGRINRLLDRNTGLETQLHYWRARFLEDAAPVQAAEDRAWVRENDPHSWYAGLLNSRTGGAHDGTWAVPTMTAASASSTDRPAWSDLPGIAPELEGSVGSISMSDLANVSTVDDGHDRIADGHEATFRDFVDTWSYRWSSLEAVEDLNRLGMDELAGPALHEWRKEWSSALYRRDRAARKLSSIVPGSTWQSLYLFTRDHYDVTRLYSSAWKSRSPETRDAWKRLVYPVAHRHEVFGAAQEGDLDPYLVLALMRAESHYNAHAVSRVGARGPMQIMPRTGALLAWIHGDAHHTAGDLHDPDVAIDYGVYYLSLLMERFDGVFPLAVASYNGGPHNVSAWLKGTGTDVPIDIFVESIPFSETRRYVKKVTGNYLTYLHLWEPADPSIRIPEHPIGDDPDVVNF